MYQKPRGNFIIMVVVIIAVSVIVIGAIYSLLVATSHAVAIFSADQRALHIAEAGMDRAVWCLNHPSVCGGTYSGETRSLTGSEFVPSLTTLSSSTRQIDVTGYVPSQSNPLKSVSLRATIGIDSTTISFNYGVQVGIGGLEMQNNSEIDGNVYSNGSIDGQNGASITGDVFVATGLKLDSSWEVNNQDQVFGQKAGTCSSSVIDVAQSFKPTESQTLNQVAVNIKKINNPPDINVHIVADNAGKPDATALATATLNSNLATSTYNWVNISFPSPTTVIAGETYWLVLDPNCENNKYWDWGKDSNNGFGNGIGKTSADWQAGTPLWDSATGDMNFKVFLGGISTHINNINIGNNAHANSILNSSIIQEADYQSIITSTVSGSSCPNVNCHPGSDDPPVQSFPVSDGNIIDWESDAVSGGTLVGNQNITSNQDLGPIKIEGDLTISNGAIVTLQGPVWVEGDIIFDVNAVIQLDSDYGDGSTVFIADNPSALDTSGIILIKNNANFFGSGSSSSYIMILSTHSGTTTHAIDVTNNTDAAIFYAHAGSIALSNNVNLKEVTGYKIIMSENATINYESGLANTSFTSGPGASWAILDNSWRRL